MDIKIDLDTFLCKLNETPHQLEDARILPCCSETVCQKCILKLSICQANENNEQDFIKCKFCSSVIPLSGIIENKIVNSIINKNDFRTCELKKNQNVISSLMDQILGNYCYLVVRF
jgi:flavoprotein